MYFCTTNINTQKLEKMKNILLLIVTGLVAFSCGDKTSEAEINEVSVEQLIASAREIDDSLFNMTTRLLNGEVEKIDRLLYHEGAQRYLEVYKYYPEHAFAPEAIEKAAALYMGIQLDDRAAEWRDTLLQKYPDFKRRVEILELQKEFYDNFFSYNPEMIQHYTQLLLNEPSISEDKKADLRLRLEHVDKRFEEFVLIINEDTPEQ
jgi:hypothetical protein